MEVTDTCSAIGLTIFHTEDHDASQSTTISFHADTETMRVERPDSRHLHPEISTFPEMAPFTLFTLKDQQGTPTRETLDLRIFFDKSILEVFINGRCTITTRVYPATKRCWGVEFWAEDERQQSKVVRADAWDGLMAEMKVV
jgi:beta-fructofuranosidase